MVPSRRDIGLENPTVGIQEYPGPGPVDGGEGTVALEVRICPANVSVALPYMVTPPPESSSASHDA